MKVALNKAHWPVTTLGYGNRIGLWFQGCSIGCPGCCSQDTWQASESDQVEIADVVAWVEQVGIEGVDGFTISGGEPLDQPEALHELLQSLRKLIPTAGVADVLLYTGYPWRTVERKWSEVVSLCDVVIAGPYVEQLPQGALAGSENQQLIPLTELARQRYGRANVPESPTPREMQIQFDGETLYMVGIPTPDLLDKMQVMLEARGICLEDVSWRS